MKPRTLLAALALLSALVRRWRHPGRAQSPHLPEPLLRVTSSVPDMPNMAEFARGSIPRPHDEMPLTVIREKERELAQRIHQAQHAAAATLAQAQQRAAVLTDIAERDGWRAAQTYYEHEMTQIEQVAARLQATGHGEACRLRQVGRSRLDHAVQTIIAFVLPT